MRSALGTLAHLVNRAPVPYVGSRSSNISLPFSQASGGEAEMRAMGAVGTLFAIVHRLSNATSQVEWQLWRTSATGDDEDREQITRHAALDLWTMPNGFMPRQEFTEVTQQHIDLTGEAWWVVARNPRSPLPLELWPVRPDRMAPVTSATDFISGYVYTGPEGEKVPLDVNEVIFLRMPNPLDPYRGMGPVQSILVDLDATRYSAEWNRNFFLNSAEPGGLLSSDRTLSDDEYNMLRDRWAEQHRGVAAAHRVAIIEGGLSWVDRTVTQRDMQFTELRQVSRDVIREAFGIPKFALGEVDDVNRATAEASMAWFASQLMVPRLERIKAALNTELLPLYGDGVADLEFDFEDPVPANREADNAELLAQANAVHLLVDAGFDPAEVLNAVGLPEIAYVSQPAFLSAGEQPPTGPGAPAQAPAPGRRVALPGHALLALDPTEEAEPKPTREDWEVRLDALLLDWADVFTEQRRELLAQITEIVNRGAPTELTAIAVDTARGTQLLKATLFEQAAAGSKRMVDIARSQDVTITPVIPTETTNRAVPVLRNLTEVEKAAAAGLAADLGASADVRTAILAQGLASGASREALRIWSPGANGEKVAGEVGDYLDNLTNATVSRELGAAIWAAENEGRFATLDLAVAEGHGGFLMTAEEMRDGSVCTPCAEIDGITYDSIEAAQADYPNGGYVDCEGGDRCRGTVVPRWEAS